MVCALHAYVHIRQHISVCVRLCVCVCIIFAHTQMHLYIHAYMHDYAHLYIQSIKRIIELKDTFAEKSRAYIILHLIVHTRQHTATK